MQKISLLHGSIDLQPEVAQIKFVLGREQLVAECLVPPIVLSSSFGNQWNDIRFHQTQVLLAGVIVKLKGSDFAGKSGISFE